MCIVNKDKLYDLLMTKYNKDWDGNKYQNDGGVMGDYCMLQIFLNQFKINFLKIMMFLKKNKQLSC